jgi:hypothetical protein
MHKKKLAIVAFAVMLIILLLSLYYFQNIYHNTAGNTVQSSVNNDGLQVSLTLNSKTTTYKQGAEIYVTVTLTNTGHKALTIFSNNAFNNSYLYNAYLGFDVRNSENVSVWGEGTGNYNGAVTLDPQKSVNDTFNWNTGSYRSTPQASTGVYQLAGFYETDNNLIATSRLQTVPINITIVKGS